ncbi:winged helix-turn-helix domain-containing protein [Caulobacter segnis]|uniref:winged helix-turn-helix domain-containing protein n=1 Tax=Caulobacter segnis TaxID=88688 RepID=UPI001CC151ED|nr:winged helix-turn-helix domain-containing protein [Caulobacter segnis]UAL11922.1 winged helix-turn-helix domain-containing protein [Caulobacter segnis]
MPDETPIKPRYGAGEGTGDDHVGESIQPIDLARAPDLALGRVLVRPSLRQVIDADDRETLLEPRVMQVLVALARADGAIVSRDDLITACWSGRIVGEDAIHRVISRLRRLADDTRAFRIETITKVGYRLLVEGAGEGASAATLRPPPRFDRRWVVGAAVLAAAVPGAGLLLGRRWLAPAKPDIAPLIAQAATALQQGTAESNDQAIGLLKRAVELRPDHAEAWGLLAFCYAAASQSRAPQFEADLTTRADEAARRAEALEPGEAYARAARIFMTPRLGQWARNERALRDLLAKYPENRFVDIMLSDLLGCVGRWREAATLADSATAVDPPPPAMAHRHVQALWAAGRLEEADRAMTRAFSLYPTHFGVWFTRFHLLLYTGRIREALAQADNVESRPENVDEDNFKQAQLVAGAMLGGAPADVDRAIAYVLAAAGQGAGHAENAIQYACGLGRPETAVRICEAYYFGKGFKVADVRFSARLKVYTHANNRRTHFLFLPSTAALRAQPAFASLTEALGLDAYWRETQTRPDYQVA